MCVRLREDEVLDTLVQRQRDGRAAPRMIHKLLKKQGRRRNRKFADLYGAFPVKGLLPVAEQLICWLSFAVCFQFFVRSGKGRSSSRRLRSGPRSARRGSRDRNASRAWRLAALASLVLRSALTPEHAAGR
jgi:hypothetical protein